jgi:lysophospholipase L1-like esterase
MICRLALLSSCLLAMLALGVNAQEKKPADAGAPANRGSIPAEKDPNRHQDFMAHKDRIIHLGGTKLVFIGDSITDGWRRDPQREVYDDYFGEYRPYNIGISGDQTQHVLWRIEHGELDGVSPRVAVIMIGTNNLGNMHQSPEETIDGIQSVVKAGEQKVPNIKILLLGVFPRGNKADDPFRAQIKQVNDAISKLDDGGKHVKYLDIGDKFLESDGTLPRTIMPDFLHPNPKGYQIWADAIKPSVDELEKD